MAADIGLAAAGTGPAMVAAIVPAAADIPAEATAAATEGVAAIGAEAAVGIADRPDRNRSRRTAFLIVVRQAAGL